MDPLSVAASIVTLIGVGTKTAEALRFTYKSYRNAPREMREIAVEIEFINGLFDNLAASMERSPEAYTEGFLKRAKNMINNVKHPLTWIANTT